MSEHLHFKSRIWSILIFVFLATFAQGAAVRLPVSGVTPTACPTTDESALWGGLTSYIETSGGAPDCWVYAHPNGVDRIIVPGAWGVTSSYAAGATEYISAAIDTLTRSRATYEPLDGALDRAITVAFIFDIRDGDPAPAHVADSLSISDYDQCIMRYAGDDRWHLVDLAGDPVDFFQFVLAHEIAHCYIGKKIGIAPAGVTGEYRR